MRQELTKEELYMLARLKRVDVAGLLHIKDCLDPKRVRGKLIRYEVACLSKDKIYKKGQIIKALMKKYGVSKSYIELIIYSNKTSKGKQCVRCGKLITVYKWGRNNGVCDSCITKAIKSYEYETDNENDIAERDEETTGSEHPDPLS